MKIVKAWWHKNSEICISLSADCVSVPKIEAFSDSPLPPYEVSRAPKSLFGKYCSYYIDCGLVHFVLNSENFDNVSPENAEYYLCGSFNGWGAAIGDQKWRLRRGESAGELGLSVEAKLLRLSDGGAAFKFASRDGRWLEPHAESPNVERDSSGNLNFRIKTRTTGANMFFLRFCSHVDMRTKINVGLGGSVCAVDVAELLHQIYSPKKLGAYLEGGCTHFSIFAPRARLAAVEWFFPDSPEQTHLIEANLSDGAVWIAKADKNLEGCSYFWRIFGTNIDEGTDFDSKFQIPDPYANAMRSSIGPSIVVYEQSLPKCAPHIPASWHDLVVMEIHLRDVLAGAGLSIPGRLSFSALAEWLSDPDCYIRKTGVNCVELQPVQEFTYEGNGYEWGYMPVNWFSPSSAYAENPEKASQIGEFAKLVESFHRAGISVLLDVVYNHFGEPNSLLKVDKEYYFEMASDGKLTNYSGCGNDLRTRSPMATRMIIDSLKRMLVNYGVDGFRFDLAELVGMDVLREIEVELKKIKPSVILIAEPWSFRGHIASHLKDTGFSSWNDGFREYAYQFARGEGDFGGFKHFINGSMGGVAKWPAQTVNYIESHDDMCFLDRLCGGYKDVPSLFDIRRYKIAYAFTLLSLGIPMLAEGFDLLRTKGGKNNTYKDAEANALNYSRGDEYAGLRQWMRALVKFRLSDSAKALRMADAPKAGFLRTGVSANGKCFSAVFNADSKLPSKRVMAVFNTAEDFSEIAVADMGGFVQIADIDRFCQCGIEDPILPKNGLLRLPPLSLALYISA